MLDMDIEIQQQQTRLIPREMSTSFSIMFAVYIYLAYVKRVAREILLGLAHKSLSEYFAMEAT